MTKPIKTVTLIKVFLHLPKFSHGSISTNLEEDCQNANLKGERQPPHRWLVGKELFVEPTSTDR